jgi:23S rRNA pseudouridine2605 synthase
MTYTRGAGERLQKVLARAGVASRRAAEALITAGRVRVDGRVVSELGVRVERRARVEVDGRRIVAEPLVYIVLHKPRGVVCTLKDPEGRPTIAEYLKEVGARVVPVGRLDFHTSGALLCTNDGEFASRLAHPRYHAQKEYVAKVRGVLDENSLERFSERIEIDGKVTRPAAVRLLRVEGDKTWIGVSLEEGKNRQVRRLGEHAGFPVLRLARVAHAGVTAERLRPGEWRHLDVDELAVLQARYGVPRRVRPAPPPVHTPGSGPKPERHAKRAFSKKPFVQKPFAQKPSAGRPFGEKSFAQKPYGSKPNARGASGERPYGSKPNARGASGERPYGSKPNSRSASGERPYAQKPFGSKPSVRKSFGEKPFAETPRPAKPRQSGGRGPGRGRGSRTQ